MAKPKVRTDRPTSEVLPLGVDTCVARLLEIASTTPQSTTPDAAIGPLLDVLASFEPGAAAGLKLAEGADELVVERRGPHPRNERKSGVPPQPSSPNDIERLFPDLAVEQSARLPAPHVGSLHLAAPEVTTIAPEAFESLVVQAAAIVALVLRSTTPTVRRAAIPRDTETVPPPSTSRLVQLEKLASIGQTASQIVHELNNPLTAIIAYSDYLSRRMTEREMPEGDVDRLHKISEAAVRIHRFCRELTDYSRPAGTLRSQLDLRLVLDNALGFCLHGLRSANITVERLYREIPPVEGMETALTQVFVNLITNAWHAMPDGGTLSLRARAEDDAVIVEVADSGHGIPKANLHRVFDAYFTTKPKGSGVGLGLSIVKKIVGDHGGDIRATATEPQGTVFVLTFPTDASS